MYQMHGWNIFSSITAYPFIDAWNLLLDMYFGYPDRYTGPLKALVIGLYIYIQGVNYPSDLPFWKACI